MNNIGHSDIGRDPSFLINDTTLFPIESKPLVERQELQGSPPCTPDFCEIYYHPDKRFIYSNKIFITDVKGLHIKDRL